MRLLPLAYCAALTATTALMLSGCVATAAYVNIPPQDGTVARNSPDAANVINAQIVALNALLNDRNYTQLILIKLPDGTAEKTYAKVKAPLNRGGIITPFDDATGEITVQVTSIRLRGTTGSIDIVSPGRGGVPQLTTVDLRYRALKGWQLERIRYSAAPVTETILYVPKPDKPAAAAPTDGE